MIAWRSLAIARHRWRCPRASHELFGLSGTVMRRAFLDSSLMSGEWAPAGYRVRRGDDANHCRRDVLVAAGREAVGMSAPRIAVGPGPNPEAAEAIRRGGGVPVSAGEQAEGLVWLSPDEAAELRAVLTAVLDIGRIQLPDAGLESFAAESLLGDGRAWTSAKGANSEPAAEHARAAARRTTRP
jgi:hypothetical protein